jgi:hypothetical protein
VAGLRCVVGARSSVRFVGGFLIVYMGGVAVLLCRLRMSGAVGLLGGFEMGVGGSPVRLGSTFSLPVGGFGGGIGCSAGTLQVAFGGGATRSQSAESLIEFEDAVPGLSGTSVGSLPARVDVLVSFAVLLLHGQSVNPLCLDALGQRSPITRWAEQ